MKNFSDNHLSNFRILLLSLLLMEFFGLLRISLVTHILTLFLVVFYFYHIWLKKDIKTYYNQPLNMIFFGLICNMICSHYYEHTSYLRVFFAYEPFLAILFFFFLFFYKPSIEAIEKNLIILSVLLCISYFIQYFASQYGISFVNVQNEQDEIRLRLNGSALSAFATFCGINKYWITNEKKYLILCLLGSSVILLMAFRTMVVSIFITIIVMNIMIKGVSSSMVKNLAILGVSFFIIYNIPALNDKIIYMIEKQQSGDNGFSNEDYVRWISLDYHLNQHFQDGIEYFFGSGLEDGDTPYYHKIKDLIDRHIGYADWGLLGLSWMIGIIPVLGMLLYAIKTVFRKYDKNYIYIAGFFIYLLLCSITTFEFSRRGNYVVQALLLYIASELSLYKENQN